MNDCRKEGKEGGEGIAEKWESWRCEGSRIGLGDCRDGVLLTSGDGLMSTQAAFLKKLNKIKILESDCTVS